MSLSAQTVREEHEQFLPWLESVRSVADSVGSVPRESLISRTDEIHGFLAHRLLPHAVAEGRLMFPAVREATNGSETSLAMNQCHVQLGRLTDELESVHARLKAGEDHDIQNELRRVLYGIHALLVGHFAQAEEVFGAVLEGMTAEERARRFEGVERSAAELTELYE